MAVCRGIFSTASGGTFKPSPSLGGGCVFGTGFVDPLRSCAFAVDPRTTYRNASCKRERRNMLLLQFWGRPLMLTHQRPAACQDVRVIVRSSKRPAAVL